MNPNYRGRFNCAGLSNQEKIDAIQLNCKFAAALNYTLKSKSNSEMSLLETNSAYVINDGPLEQELKTSEWSKKYLISKSTTVGSSIEFTSEKSGSLNLGIEMGPVKFGGEMTMTSGQTSGTSESKTIETSEETTVTSPAQTVKVSAHSKVPVTSKLFTYLETNVYLMDLEISKRNTSLIAYRDSLFSLENRFSDFRTRYFFLRISPNDFGIFLLTGGGKLESYVEIGDEPEDSLMFVTESGEYRVYNMPIVVKNKVYHVEITIGAETPI